MRSVTTGGMSSVVGKKVVGERRVPHRTVLQENLLHHRESEALRDPAFKLSDDRAGLIAFPTS